ncbi:OmpA family protein [Flavobacterium sp. ZT3R18]|uniref:OmpA family protein n=1 Tax=Flavobacterium sp. ZT3R18 TaxID=2594429 RepID=UPI00117B2A92|nr:OmpA family protein [Flavobacterium sp. ZT3R18]TRX30901.1 OmpA family protein [Flavobacterium sp. ZT3R18]
MAKGVKRIKWTGKGKVIGNLSIPNKKVVISPDQDVFFEVDLWHDGTTETDKKESLTWMLQDRKKKIIISQKTLPASTPKKISIPKALCGPFEYYVEASLSGNRNTSKDTGLIVSGYCEPKITTSKWCTTNDGDDVSKSHVFSYGEAVYLSVNSEGLNGHKNLIVDVFRHENLKTDPLIFTYTSVDVIDGEINLAMLNTFSWYGKIKGIKEDEEFYVKIKDPSTSSYIVDSKHNTELAQFLKIKKKIVSRVVKPPTNLTPLKVGKPDEKAERYEPCKFETIAIDKTIVFDKGKKLQKVIHLKEAITKTIFFDIDSSIINSEGNTSISNVLQFLLEHEHSTITIDGYACVIGKENYNNILSQKRSDAVKKMFINGGLEAQRIISKGHGEINATDDKMGRDNIKYKDKREYIDARRVDISFVFNGHDAQTIVYETIAPSHNKNVTIDITEYQNKACFREKDKHKKKIMVSSPEYDKPLKKEVVSLAFPVHSSLSILNPAPMQYIWPKWNLTKIAGVEKSIDSATSYSIHVHSCRYFSNDKNATVIVKAYPDIKWTLEFSFNFSNPVAYTHGNLPEYGKKISDEESKYQAKLSEADRAKRQQDLQKVKEITREMRGAQSKAVSVGKENARLQNSPEMLSKFGLKLSAEWDEGKGNSEFGIEFAKKLRKVLDVFIKYKEMADKVKDTLGGDAKGKALSKTPFMFEIQSPSLNANISWYLEKGVGIYESQVATVGTLNFKADPLMGANFIVDLLALGSRMHPAVAAMVTGIKIGLSALHGGMTFEATFFGNFSFDFKALEFNSLTGVKGGNLDLGAKVGIKINLKINFEVKSQVWGTEVVVELIANAMLDAYFVAKIVIDSDAKGVFAKPELGFSGLIIKLEAEIVVNRYKRTLKLGNDKEPFLKSDIVKFDPIYII